MGPCLAGAGNGAADDALPLEAARTASGRVSAVRAAKTSLRVKGLPGGSLLVNITLLTLAGVAPGVALPPGCRHRSDWSRQSPSPPVPHRAGWEESPRARRR